MYNDSNSWVFVQQDNIAPNPKIIQLTGDREETKQKVKRLYPELKFFQYSARAYYRMHG